VGKGGEGKRGEKLDNNQTASSAQQTGRFLAQTAAPPPYPVPQHPSSIPLSFLEDLLPKGTTGAGISLSIKRWWIWTVKPKVWISQETVKPLGGWREEKERQSCQPWHVWKGLNRKSSALCWKLNPEESLPRALDANLVQLNSPANASLFHFPSKCFNGSVWDGRAKHPITQLAKAVNNFVKVQFFDKNPVLEISVTSAASCWVLALYFFKGDTQS